MKRKKTKNNHANVRNRYVRANNWRFRKKTKSKYKVKGEKTKNRKRWSKKTIRVENEKNKKHLRERSPNGNKLDARKVTNSVGNKRTHEKNWYKKRKRE